MCILKYDTHMHELFQNILRCKWGFFQRLHRTLTVASASLPLGLISPTTLTALMPNLTVFAIPSHFLRRDLSHHRSRRQSVLRQWAIYSSNDIIDDDRCGECWSPHNARLTICDRGVPTIEIRGIYYSCLDYGSSFIILLVHSERLTMYIGVDLGSNPVLGWRSTNVFRSSVQSIRYAVRFG